MWNYVLWMYLFIVSSCWLPGLLDFEHIYISFPRFLSSTSAKHDSIWTYYIGDIPIMNILTQIEVLNRMKLDWLFHSIVYFCYGDNSPAQNIHKHSHVYINTLMIFIPTTLCTLSNQSNFTSFTYIHTFIFVYTWVYS